MVTDTFSQFKKDKLIPGRQEEMLRGGRLIRKPGDSKKEGEGTDAAGARNQGDEDDGRMAEVEISDDDLMKDLAKSNKDSSSIGDALHGPFLDKLI